MGKNVFFTSDAHFGHSNMCKFINYDGTKARNFDDYLEADAVMIENWNKLVQPHDVVYILGDIAYSCGTQYAEACLNRLNGKLKIYGGNHDKLDTAVYLKHAEYFRGCGHYNNYFLSHVPIHPDSKGRFKLNIHGHIHNAIVYKKEYYWNGTEIIYKEVPDPFYFNVCVDYKYRYAPIPFEEIETYYQSCLDKGLLQPIPPKSKKMS